MPSFQQRIRSVLTDPKSFATTLLVAVWDRYGPDLTSWSPTTVLMELNQDFSMEMPKPNFDRLMAAVSLVTSDEYYVNLPAFIRLSNIFSGDAFDPLVFDPADCDEMAWGITEAMLLHPSENPEPFSDDIRWYMGYMLDIEGVMNPPDVLRLALRDKVRENIPTEYADDPEMFQAMWSSQNDRSEEIKRIVKTNLQELLRQVTTLPLVYGDVDDLVKKIQTGLSGN